MLTWDESEVIACLEVLPEEGQPGHGVHHTFNVRRNGLRLEVHVRQYDGDVAVAVFRDGQELPAFRHEILGCKGIRVVSERGRAYLEIAPPDESYGRYDGCSPIPWGLRVFSKPEISVTTFI